MRDKILYWIPHIQSQASLRYLQRQLRGKPKWERWLDFRIETLTNFLIEEGALVCTYCGKGPLRIEAANCNHDVATLDHVIPRSKGGAEFDIDNLVVSCYKCNQKKADKI